MDRWLDSHTSVCNCVSTTLPSYTCSPMRAWEGMRMTCNKEGKGAGCVLSWGHIISCVVLPTSSQQWSWTGVPNLWDLRPNDLKESWYNNNRNKICNTCNVLQSSHKPSPLSESTEKNVFQEIWYLVPKGLGTTGLGTDCLGVMMPLTSLN